MGEQRHNVRRSQDFFYERGGRGGIFERDRRDGVESRVRTGPHLSVSLFLGTAVLLGIFSVPLDACMLRRQSGICLVLLNFIASIYFCEKKYWGDTGVCFLPWRIRD